MGGGKAAGDPGYDNIHLQAHAWMLTEDTINQTSHTNANFNPTTTNAGIVGAFNDVRSSSLGGSPYSLVNVFDPLDSGNRFQEVMEEADKYLEVIKEETPGEAWDSSVDLVDTALGTIETTFRASITGRVDDLKDKLQAESVKEIAQINAAAMRGNSTLHSTRLMQIASVERDNHRTLADFRSSLQIEDLRSYRKLLIEGGLERVRQINENNSLRVQAVQSLIAATDLWAAAQRQYSEDELKLAVEDAIWDLKLYDFAGKGLSAISGAAIIPGGSAQENKTLSSISTFASAGATVAGSF